ncbi:MAG: Wzz/FepE/Etk N-terminal domain-containing protein [Hydrogenovibrio sp.]|uniref:Wzz/FepE/Etk N-terminal domain-containing protein n=1 Tax=Hydrogenovibrio sp. TaxID=2065821 RepID=UPI0028703021|nr:Wzz/FepE/Etk N-terminal domain-containing protein [Hydrogenovibrio sp.]MDR9499972.1 Wzz/FepE/Etk N-terminal domain-containing protein [Hydrogenovibrio sp.]
MQETLPPRPANVADDEIDLFELFQSLWEQKWLIVITTFGAVFFAFLFTVVVPVKDVTYTGSALVEVATIEAEGTENRIQVIENSEDTVLAMNNANAVSASVPRRSTKMIEIKATAKQSSEVQQRLEESIQYVVQRHRGMVDNLKGVRVLRATQQIGKTKVVKNSPSEKLNLILAVAFVLGAMLGIFVALIRSALRKRKADIAPQGGL